MLMLLSTNIPNAPMKKKILITGPIGDFGGRDVEVNIIARVLEDEYHVKVLSTIYMSQDSYALQNLKKTAWNTVSKVIYENNNGINCLSRFSKFFNKGKDEAYGYVNNSLSKKLFDLDKLYLDILQKEILQSDLVLLCVQLTSKFLHEIVAFCDENKIPCLVRTTGTIRKVHENDADFLRKVSLFLHHSEANAANLNNQITLPYTVIDQCALTENDLLSQNSKPGKPFRFGYLGRLSVEKGILPVAHFFAQTDLPFIIAGDGPQKTELETIIAGKSNCIFLGLLSNKEIVSFFNQIDVLIIPSYEESGPLVGLEAMAAQKLIVSTKVGAMEERLKGLNSYWFDIENLSSLQTCINQINDLSLDQYRQEVTQLKSKYLQEYSLNAIASKYKKLLLKILE
jgi:glycosyltransferase involved in cell wall biosynthesis